MLSCGIKSSPLLWDQYRSVFILTLEKVTDINLQFFFNSCVIYTPQTLLLCFINNSTAYLLRKSKPIMTAGVEAGLKLHTTVLLVGFYDRRFNQPIKAPNILSLYFTT